MKYRYAAKFRKEEIVRDTGGYATHTVVYDKNGEITADRGQDVANGIIEQFKSLGNLEALHLEQVAE